MALINEYDLLHIALGFAGIILNCENNKIPAVTAHFSAGNRKFSRITAHRVCVIAGNGNKISPIHVMVGRPAVPPEIVFGQF
jgi:hypothetical protein